MEQKLVAVERICQRLISEGQAEEGLRYLELLIHLRVQSFGASSDETWEAIQWTVEQANVHAMRLLDQGEFNNSVKHLRRAKQLTGTQGWSISADKARLRCRAITRGKTQDALNYAKNAMAIEAQLDPKEVENPAGTMLNMCAILSQLGKHDEAYAYSQEAMTILQSQPMNAKNALNLGMAYYNLAVEQEHMRIGADTCLKTYKTGLRFCEAHLGLDHPFTISIRDAYQQLKKQIQARRSPSPKQKYGSRADKTPSPMSTTWPDARKAPSPLRESPLPGSTAKPNTSTTTAISDSTLQLDLTTQSLGAMEFDGDVPSQSQTQMQTQTQTQSPGGNPPAADSDLDEDLTPSKMDELRKRAQEIARLVNVKEWNPSREVLVHKHHKEPSLPPSTPMERAKSRAEGRATTANSRGGRPDSGGLGAEYTAADDLCKAALHGDLHQMRFLVEKAGVDPIAYGVWGVTPLHCAAVAGHVACVRYLVEQGADPMAKVDSPYSTTQDRMKGSTPLHWAAFSWRGGNGAVVDDLIRANPEAAASVDDFGWPPLFYACARGDVGACESLLSVSRESRNGMDLSYVARPKDTSAAHIAAAAGQETVLSLIIQSGGSVERRNKNGDTPLILAARYAHKKALDLLIKTLRPSGSVGSLELGADWTDTEISKMCVTHFSKDKRRLNEDDMYIAGCARAMEKLRMATLFSDQSASLWRINDVATYIDRLHTKSYFHTLQAYIMEHHRLYNTEMMIEDRTRQDASPTQDRKSPSKSRPAK